MASPRRTVVTRYVPGVVSVTVLPFGSRCSRPVTSSPAAVVKRSELTAVYVIDAAGRPIGRILADDVVDALLPHERERRRFSGILN
jgi:hypothetical protein